MLLLYEHDSCVMCVKTFVQCCDGSIRIHVCKDNMPLLVDSLLITCHCL